MKFDNYLLKLERDINQKYKENICLHGISSIIKEIYADFKKRHNREAIKKLKNKLGINYQTFYSWISDSNPIPISKAYQLLNFWKETCKKSEKEFNKKWDFIYRNNQGFSQNGQKEVSLPLEFNEDIAYLIGFFQGDGHLKKENKKTFQEYSIYFYEKNKKVLNQINEILYKNFRSKGRIYFQTRKNGHWFTLRISSKPLYIFFKNILNLKVGKKVRNIETPEIIKISNNSMQLSFIKGFFDAEGGIGETKKNPWLDIGQASNEKPCEILSWIRDKLKNKEIILSEPKRTKNQEFFRIRTSKRETIKKFFDIISSNHPEKITRFNTMINK